MRKSLQQDPLDKFLIDRLDNHEIQPPIELWSKLSKRLEGYPPQKLSWLKRWKFWIIGSSLVVLLLAGILYMTNQRNARVDNPEIQPLTLSNRGSSLISPSNSAGESHINKNFHEELILGVGNSQAMESKAVDAFVNDKGTIKAQKPILETYELLPLSAYLEWQIKSEIVPDLDLIRLHRRKINSSSMSTAPNKQFRLKIPKIPKIHLPVIPDFLPGNAFADRLDLGYTLKPLSAFTIPFINSSSSNYEAESNYNFEDEHGFLTISTGLFLRYHISQAVSIGMGFSYSELAQKLHINQVYREQVGLNKYIIHTKPGSLLFTYAGSSLIPDESIINSSLKHHFLNIPLDVRLSVKKWLYFDIGVCYSRLVRTELDSDIESFEGDILSSSLMGVNHNYFGTSIGLGAFVKLSDRWFFEAGPDIRFLFMKYDKASDGQSLPAAFGFNFGLSYKLSNSKR